MSAALPMPQSGGPMAQWAYSPRETDEGHRPTEILRLPERGPIAHPKPQGPMAQGAYGPPPRKTERDRNRYWLKTRFSAKDADAGTIVEGWKAQKKGTEHLGNAIRLFDALLRGDIDTAREINPLVDQLVDAPKKEPKNKLIPLLDSDLKESDLKTESESESEKEGDALTQMMTAIGEVTETDVQINQRKVKNLAKKLLTGGYTPDDCRTWLVSSWRIEWPGKNGDKPTLTDLQQRIGRVRNLPPLPPVPADQASTGETNPYLEDEYFTRHTDDEPKPPVDNTSDWPPEGCNGGGVAKDPFLATLNQLQIQLNRATYDTWLKHAEPIHFAGDRMRGGTLYVSVPHVYCKDWIDRHLLTAMTRAFDDIANYSGEKRGRISEEVLFRIEIIVEGDPVPGLDTQ